MSASESDEYGDDYEDDYSVESIQDKVIHSPFRED